MKIITFLFPSAGENADVFKLCRKDKSSISRHNARRHNNSKDAPVIKSFYDKDEIVAKARDCLLKLEKEEEKKKNKGGGKQDTELAPKVSIKSLSDRLPSQSESSESAPSEPIASRLQTSLLDTLVRREENNDSTDADDFVRDSSLHAKVDTLLVELKALKLKDQTSTKKNDPSFPSPLAAVDSKCHKEVADLMLKWPHAKNLIDLTNICQQLRFFGGDAEKGVLAILRYETCYNFLLSKRTASLTTNPVAVAKKGLCG